MVGNLKNRGGIIILGEFLLGFAENPRGPCQPVFCYSTQKLRYLKRALAFENFCFLGF